MKRIISGVFGALGLAALAGCLITEAPPPSGSGYTCEGDVCTVTGPILDDTTFTSDLKWVLKGGVFVGDDLDPTARPTTLTIEPGTTIYGDTASISFLLITRGSKIMAEGTQELPITFTSANDEGARSRSDWGGLILNGQAPVNGCAGDPCTLQGEAGTGTYGGSNVNDNSGVLKFVRVEFPGKLIDDENELNGISFQGVGDGTVVDFIQVHMGGDDCVEFFGGTVNAKHIVCTGIGDDNLDWTFGWTGRVQFLVAQQHGDAGDSGIEADNNEDNNTLEPFSDPVLSNVTLVGSTGQTASGHGVLLRRGTKATLENFVVMGWDKSCLDIDDEASLGFAGTDITVQNSIFDCEDLSPEEDGDPIVVEDFVTNGPGNVIGAAGLADPNNTALPNFKPADGSPALSGAVIPADAFFDDVEFKGAMGAEDWASDWCKFPAN